MQLDQVLGLAARAVERVVEPFGAAAPQVGHDVADVQSLRAGLDPRRHAPLASPGLGAVAGLGVAAHHHGLSFGATHPDIVGSGLDQPAQHGVAGQAEDVVHVVGLAPRHHLGTAVVTIAADGQPRGRPMAADAAHQATQMAAHFASPDGVLPGRSSTATGREVAVS